MLRRDALKGHRVHADVALVVVTQNDVRFLGKLLDKMYSSDGRQLCSREFTKTYKKLHIREENFQKEVYKFYLTKPDIPKWISDELDSLIKINLSDLFYIKHWIVILKYIKGDFFKKHTDDSYDDRFLSGGVELVPNSNYKGGRLITSNEINDTDVGQFFTHTTKELHFVEEITEGVRYSLHFPIHKLSDWKLVYCLSKRLAKTEDSWNTTLELFKKSVQMSSVFHNVKQTYLYLT